MICRFEVPSGSRDLLFQSLLRAVSIGFRFFLTAHRSIMQNSRVSMIVRTAMIIVLVASVVAVTAVPMLRPSALLARYWNRQLQSIPEELVVSRLQQIAELDGPGTEVLVDALCNERSTFVQAAGRALRNQLDRWTHLTSDQSTPRVARMAHLLANHVDQLNPAAWGSPPTSRAGFSTGRSIHSGCGRRT